jgi:hypothetical protein
MPGGFYTPFLALVSWENQALFLILCYLAVVPALWQCVKLVFQKTTYVWQEQIEQ